MKRKNTQKHALKIQKKKAIKSLRKKVNKQNRKIRKRAKAAKMVKTKENKRRSSDQTRQILSPSPLEITESEFRPLTTSHDPELEDNKTLLTRQALLEIFGPTIFKALSDLDFDLDMLITEKNLDILEEKLERNRKELDKLEGIKIAQD
ncbi:MAG: hypothetical protein Q7T50_01435 [Candidatus Magasanikbacteria bacterium]|nr:hypothetical protein [Candidatus Magasanikbacteria bacterium]